MKKIVSTIALGLSLTSIFAQQSNNSLNYLASNDSFIYTETGHKPTSSEIDLKSQEKKHKAFKSMRRSGVVMTSIGGAFLLAGTYGMIYGNNINKGSFDSNFIQFMGTTAVIGGGAGTLAGLTLWILGNNKMKQFPLSNEKVSFNIGANSMKLTYRF